VAGLQFGRGKTEKLFSGERIFRFASANLFLDFVRPQKGVWGMNAGGLNLIFWRGRLSKKKPKKLKRKRLRVFPPEPVVS